MVFEKAPAAKTFSVTIAIDLADGGARPSISFNRLLELGENTPEYS